MRRILPLLTAGYLITALPHADAAPAAESVGLGAAAGIAIPHAGPVDYSPALNWGFFVDIPLISTFSIQPAALVYGVKPSREGAQGDPNTDISLSFKFVVPINRFAIFAGITAGLTTSTDLDLHVGGLAGFSVSIVSNLEIFVQASYRVLLDEGSNRNDAHVFAGPLFRFR